jgi:hypothetical protein
VGGEGDRSGADVARVLKPEGRFALTTWLSRGGNGAPPFPIDYQPLLTAAGLVVEAFHEPPDWRVRELAVFAGGCEPNWGRRSRRCSWQRLRRCPTRTL